MDVIMKENLPQKELNFVPANIFPLEKGCLVTIDRKRILKVEDITNSL